MNPFAVLQCGWCGEEHSPSCFAADLELSPSGADLIGEFECHECGAQSIVAFERGPFEHWLGVEMEARTREARKQMGRAIHKAKSQIGREVAQFRNRLQRVETVGDIEAWQ